MARARVIDKDRGYKKIVSDLRKLQGQPYVKIGVLEKAGDHSDSSFTVAQVASFHEFGTETIPERSFLRGTLAAKKNEIGTAAARFLKDRIYQKVSTEGALNRLGLYVKSLIQGRIRAGIAPPLEETTIARKGSSKPLIDTGQLLNSIQHEVVLDE